MVSVDGGRLALWALSGDGRAVKVRWVIHVSIRSFVHSLVHWFIEMVSHLVSHSPVIHSSIQLFSWCACQSMSGCVLTTDIIILAHPLLARRSAARSWQRASPAHRGGAARAARPAHGTRMTRTRWIGLTNG